MNWFERFFQTLWAEMHTPAGRLVLLFVLIACVYAGLAFHTTRL